MRNSSNHSRQPTSQTCRLAVDIGGTFTDIVLETTNQRYSCKVLTSVNQPELGVMQGIKQLLKESGVDAKEIQTFIHGPT